MGFFEMWEAVGPFLSKCFFSGDSAKALWDHFRQNDPSAGLRFEKLLQSISESIRQKQKEKINMEDFIRTQNQARAHQVTFSLLTRLFFLVYFTVICRHFSRVESTSILQF